MRIDLHTHSSISDGTDAPSELVDRALQVGLDVIAHPWGRGREQILPPEVLGRLTAEQGLDGIEVDHQDHDPDTRVRLRGLAGELDLLATGSSDYHGTGKLDHDLGCNTTDPAVFDTLMDRLATRRVS